MQEPTVTLKDDISAGPIQANSIVESDRTRELDRRQQYYDCSQHNYKRFDWDGRAIQTGPQMLSQPLLSSEQAPYYVPLKARRPSSPYRLARVIVNAHTSLLFGEQRWPSIQVSNDPDTQDFANVLMKVAGMSAKFIQARNIGGSTGTVGISWCFDNGTPRIDVHYGKHLVVTEWDSRDDLIPANVVEIYRYAQDLWNPQKHRNERQWFWHRRDWTKTADVAYQDVPVKQVSGKTQEPEWTVDAEHTFQHNDGFCHFVWIQNIATSEVDGLPDYDGLYENFDYIDILLSVLCRGTVLNLDPTLVLKMDPDIVTRFGIKKGSDNALTVGLSGGAEYLTLGSSSVDAGLKLFDAKRRCVLEVAQCVLPDPNEIAASGTSSVALKMIYSPMIQRGEILREQYGTAIKRLIEQMMKVAQAKFGQVVKSTGEDGIEQDQTYTLLLPQKAIKATDNGVETTTYSDRTPGEGQMFELTWGPWFTQTSADLLSAQTMLTGATGAKTFMSQQTAVELMAMSTGREPEEEWKRIQNEKEQVKSEQEGMFGPSLEGMGGKVAEQGQLPPGATPPKLKPPIQSTPIE